MLFVYLLVTCAPVLFAQMTEEKELVTYIKDKYIKREVRIPMRLYKTFYGDLRAERQIKKTSDSF